MSKNAIVLIMAKNPELGEVKTRLATDIGEEEALKVYKMLMKKTEFEVKASGYESAVFFTKEIDKECLDADHYLTQSDGDLGEKMKAALTWAFENGYKAAVLIGTDCYDLKRRHLRDAFESLEVKDLVIGPAKDGGYYLIGMKEAHPELFDRMPWSTEHVLPYTLDRAGKNLLSYRLIDVLNDIDTQADYREVREKLLNDIY